MIWPFNMPLCLTQMSKNNFIDFIIMIVNPNLENLENLSTTTKMSSFLCHFKVHLSPSN